MAHCHCPAQQVRIMPHIVSPGEDQYAKLEAWCLLNVCCFHTTVRSESQNSNHHKLEAVSIATYHPIHRYQGLEYQRIYLLDKIQPQTKGPPGLAAA